LIAATEIFCLNELGKRANNQDSIAPKKGEATIHDKVFVVCDGVGGEKKGEVASNIVSSSIHGYLKTQSISVDEELPTIQKAIQYANKNLTAYIATDVAARRMSTTLALALLGHQSVIAVWCGDSRIHHIRNGKIIWKSRDHSLVGELVNRGELTEEEARNHPRRNVITRSLNALNFNSTVDFYEIKDFENGDYFLLCTDGFLENINDELINKVLMDDEEYDKAKAFLCLCDGVTRDNFSMYLIRAKHATSDQVHQIFTQTNSATR
jgi:serine/threonine protein phosphatase PrpC